jgi:hypothetical protein
LGSPSDGNQPEPRNDTPRADAKPAPKKPRADPKQTAKDSKQADVGKAEKQAKEIVALGARVFEKVRLVTSDSNINGKDWAMPMVISVKTRTDDLQQRIKDNPQMTFAVLHAI